jgi:S1-C subfamily serine protease
MVRYLLSIVAAAAVLTGTARGDDAPRLAGAPKLAAAPRLERADAAAKTPAAESTEPEGGFVNPAAATVTVHVPTEGGAGWKGTGTVVWSEGGRSWVVTNYHVVEDNRGTFVVERNIDGKRYPARVLNRSGEGDAVVLEVDTVLPAAVLGTDQTAGTAVTHYGNTTGPKRGKVVGYEQTQTTRWKGEHMLTDYVSDSGDSGAGVFNDRGELVGVHWGGPSPDRPGDGLRRVAHVGVVRRLLGASIGNRCPRLAARLADNNPTGVVAARLDARADARAPVVAVASAAPKADCPCVQLGAPVCKDAACPVNGGAGGCACAAAAAPKMTTTTTTTRFYSVRGGPIYTADQFRIVHPDLAAAVGLAPGGGTAAGTCAGGVCRPAAAYSGWADSATWRLSGASPCAGGRCPPAR